MSETCRGNSCHADFAPSANKASFRLARPLRLAPSAGVNCGLMPSSTSMVRVFPFANSSPLSVWILPTCPWTVIACLVAAKRARDAQVAVLPVLSFQISTRPTLLYSSTNAMQCNRQLMVQSGSRDLRKHVRAASPPGTMRSCGDRCLRLTACIYRTKISLLLFYISFSLFVLLPSLVFLSLFFSFVSTSTSPFVVYLCVSVVLVFSSDMLSRCGLHGVRLCCFRFFRI